jgi:large subunit ribosomal protein L10
MLRQDKERIVSELADRLKNSETLLVADYRGLTMTEIDDLRTKLLESGARFSVVKNTLTRLAAEEAGVKQLLDLVEGPTAIAFIDSEGDPVAAAKILNDAARANDVLVIRGGLLEGDTVGDVEIKRLATLPPADVLRAQLAGAVVGPLTMVVGLFTAPLRDVVGIIDARITQLREQGDTSEAEAPAAEATAEEPTAEAEAASGDEPDAGVAPEPEAAEAETAPEAEPEATAEAEAEPEAEETSEEPSAEAEQASPESEEES